MRAGACQVDITPPPGGEVPGQWLRRIAERVRDPLAATALALESGGRRVALVSCDVLSLKNRIVADLRARLSSLVEPAYLLVAATHTHTGPPICDALGSTADEERIAHFARSVEAAVRGAFDCLEPARLGWATGAAPGLAFPRRWRMADGTVQMHPRKDDPALVEPEGEADDTLTVLRVTRADGSPLALCVNFACHPIFLGPGSFYSADYPGVVRREAQQALGALPVLYLNGPCGDIGPDDVGDPARQRYGEEPMEAMGQALAARAVELARQAPMSDEPELGAASEVITAAVRAVPPDDLRAAQEWAQGRDLAQAPSTAPEVALRELLLVEAERRTSPTVEVEIGGLRVGAGALLALPGEIFAAIGRDIRAASPFAHTALVELANGAYGYVPTADAFRGGGYETRLCRSSRLAPETAAAMVRAGGEVLARLAG